jgi:hypothetical protein
MTESYRISSGQTSGLLKLGVFQNGGACSHFRIPPGGGDKMSSFLEKIADESLTFGQNFLQPPPGGDVTLRPKIETHLPKSQGRRI